MDVIYWNQDLSELFVANRVADIPRPEIGPSSVVTYSTRTKLHWRRNKRAGPDKLFRWKLLVPEICFSTWGGDTLAFRNSLPFKWLQWGGFLLAAAVENGTICGQWWNPTRRRETKNFQSTLQWQKPFRIISPKKRRILKRPHPQSRSS